MTLLEVLNATTDYLRKNGVPTPKLDAELLLAHTLNLPRLQLYLQFDRPLSPVERDRLRPLVKRRAARDPLQHLIGTVDFFGCHLTVSPAALIPRPETELLVETLLFQIPNDRPVRIIDVGTGSGAIALALGRARPLAHIIGIDTSPEALALAEHNRIRLNLPQVTFQSGNLLNSMDQPVDWVVANLPYLTTDEMAALQPELLKEPTLALAGGPDGLDLIRQLIPQARQLASNLALEIGIAQGPAVLKLLTEAGFAHATIKQDLTGRDRFAFAHTHPL
ncbi:MAG: peptide chain release factor N(5)-glutamine methyltransferase [Verrucomicrobiia bacterium]